MAFDHKTFITLMVQAFAAALKADMDEAGCNNYACFKLSTEDGSRYLATFTKIPEGKTPVEMHEEAMAEVARLRDIINKIRNESSGDCNQTILSMCDEAMTPNAEDHRTRAARSDVSPCSIPRDKE
jgi:hypothetical protein